MVTKREDSKQRDFLEKEIQYMYVLDLEKVHVEEKYKNTVVYCKDGALFVSFSVHPKDSLFDGDIIEDRAKRLTLMLNTLFDNRYTINLSFRKRKVAANYEDMLSSMEDGSAKELERIRSDYFNKSIVFYDNEIYLSIIKKPMGMAAALTESMVSDFINVVQRMESFIVSADLNLEILRGSDLTQYLWDNLTHDSDSAFMNIKSDKTLSELMVDQISELNLTEIPLRINGRNIQCITLPNMPDNTYADMVGMLRYMPYELEMVVKYDCLSRPEMNAAEEKQRTKYRKNKVSLGAALGSAFSGNDDAASPEKVDIDQNLKQAACEEAIRYTSETGCSGGYISVSFVIWSDNSDDLEYRKKELIASLTKSFIPSCAEKYMNTYSYFCSWVYSTYRYHNMLVLSENMADFFPVSATTSSLLSKNLYEITGSKVPLLYGKNADGTLYRFSPSGATGEKGHTLVVAPAGGGKSVFLSLMASQWLKYENSQVIFIDMDMSALNVVYNNGGKIFYPGVDKTTFSPFRFARDNKDVVIRFCEALCVANKKQFTPKMNSDCLEAIKHLEYGNESLREFYGLVKGLGSEFGEVLYPYVIEKDSLFGSKKDSLLDLPRTVLIETSHLLRDNGERITIPALIYIFFRLDRVFDGLHPVLLILDEAWKFLKDDYFASIIEDWIKTLRKKHVYVIIATQEIADITSSSVSNAIVNNCETRIFLANQRAKDPFNKVHYENLGIQEKDIEAISKMPQFTAYINQNNQVNMVNFMTDKRQLEYIVTTQKFKAEYEARLRSEK